MVLDGHDLKKQDALDLVTNLKTNSTFIFQKAKELKKKGFSASIDPKGKLTIGFKKEW